MNILERWFQTGWGSKDMYNCGDSDDDDDELWTCAECWAKVSEEELVMLPCFLPMCSLCLAHRKKRTQLAEPHYSLSPSSSSTSRSGLHGLVHTGA